MFAKRSLVYLKKVIALCKKDTFRPNDLFQFFIKMWRFCNYWGVSAIVKSFTFHWEDKGRCGETKPRTILSYSFTRIGKILYTSVDKS